MADHPGNIVEILKNGTLKPAFVIEESAKKLIVSDENGRQFSAPISTVICYHNIKAKRDTASTLIAELKEQKKSITESIDIELLWEGVHTIPKEYSAKELASTYFSEASSPHYAAIFEILIQDKLYFKQKGISFTPRSADKVEELVASEKRRIENEQFKKEASAWIKKILKSQPDTEEEKQQKTLNQIEDFLVNNNHNDASEILTNQFKLHPKEVAWKILKKCGRLTQYNDPTLLIANVKEEFSQELLDEAVACTAFTGNERSDEHSINEPFSIDDEETKEVDDAISVCEHPEHISVAIHIADISYFIKKESALDKEALHRTISIYLPTGTVPMFPPEIAYNKASLNQKSARPALSLLADFSHEGELLSYKFALSSITVQKRLSYNEADNISPEEPFHKKLAILSTITQALNNQRLKANGFTINRPEVKIKVEKDKIDLSIIEPNSSSRKIVQELMILYNSLAAEFAIKNDIPVIFRAQPAPNTKTFPVGTEIEYTPGKMGPIFKQLKPARLSLKPMPHAGLGAKAYIQASSPIRRYADLIIQRQLSAFLSEKELPYQRDDLWRILAAAESTEKEMSALEKKSKRFWILRYLELNSAQLFQGAIIESNSKQPIVELNNFGVRGMLCNAGPEKNDSEITVSIKEIDPHEERLLLEKKENAQQ